jgi:hypothetical protein
MNLRTLVPNSGVPELDQRSTPWARPPRGRVEWDSNPPENGISESTPGHSASLDLSHSEDTHRFYPSGPGATAGSGVP